MMSGTSPLDGVAEGYRARGIGGALVPGSRIGVVVVDFINGFTDPQWAPGFRCDAQVDATARLLDAARGQGVPIFFTTIIFEEARQKASVWLAKMPAMACLTPGSPSVAIDPRLTPGADEPIIAKTAASSFTGTDLGAQLVQHGVDTLLLCGATTSGCVRATAVDACMGGWRPFLIRDCVADRAAQVHEASLFDVQAKYGEVIDLQTALSFFDGIND